MSLHFDEIVNTFSNEADGFIGFIDSLNFSPTLKPPFILAEQITFFLKPCASVFEHKHEILTFLL